MAGRKVAVSIYFLEQFVSAPIHGLCRSFLRELQAGCLHARS